MRSQAEDVTKLLKQEMNLISILILILILQVTKLLKQEMKQLKTENERIILDLEQEQSA